MFLLEGASVPDHATFARFRSIHFAPCARRIFAEMSNALFDLGEISGETVFIDSTKIEAAANKYQIIPIFVLIHQEPYIIGKIFKISPPITFDLF